MSSFNLSELFESVVDVVGDRTAIATPTRRLTYTELDERANQLAHHLAANGVGAGDHVGLYLLNGTEYLEAMLAAFKLRAVPININYRYVERELEHLFTDADLAALIFHRGFADRVAAVAPKVPTLRLLLVVEDESGADLGAVNADEYEAALAASSSERTFADRSGDDHYVVYTGGTTGMPKGVVWRHEDIFFGAMGGGDPLLDKGPISDPDELTSRISDFAMAQLSAPPLMHVSAHWGAFITFFGGGKVVLLGPGRFDGADVWRTISAETVNVITVVGDAMARPVLDALAADPDGCDASSLFAFASGGAVLSPATKAQLGELLPNVMVIDAYGSSETGIAGSRSSGAGDTTGARFSVDARTAVLDDDLQPVVPGSGQVGRLARQGHVPLGYHKDEVKTKATFVTVDGIRWVLPGDMATIDEDGTVVLLGRGSGSINTGGEKVFPEEVEAVLKGHPAVMDVLVVGVPDDRWGEKVTAVTQLRPGATLTLDDLNAVATEGLAGYKLPRQLIVVDEVRRGANAKPDYAWAKEQAHLVAGEA